ncbi:MAG: TonB-dependent receptor [Candidatus Sulfopaludibacter sp.]|nr:TonB-dependent receptor [Candidatus Sulfopaludibacter sp.]
MSIGKLGSVAWLMAAASVLFAQTDRGSIEGTVKDPNGAIVPAAKVQVVNIDTNNKFDFSTNDVGYYLASSLPVGSYRVIVQKEGFRTIVREPILVSAQNNLDVEFTLQLGALTDTITVSGEAPLLDVSATSNPSNLSAKFIDDLPMIVFGEKRNITDNLRFLPGDTSSNGALNSGEPAESWSGRVNSAVQGSTEVFIDGAPSSEWGTRRGAVLENGPVVEQVQEYTVVANAFNAEYGGFGSWFTTVTMKSGTNTIHGKAYDYFGNDALNARNFFQGPVLTKLRQNEGGFQFGGPVYIPKVYDGRNKTFLFFGQGLYYARLGGTGGLQTIPTPDFRTGNFTGLLAANGTQIPIFDPNSTQPDGNGSFIRTQFPGNIIPTSRISPVSSKIAALLPNPDRLGATNNWYNRTGAFPYFNTFTSTAKVDHNVSTKQKISVTYENQWRPRLINSNGWGNFANVVSGLPNEPDVLEGFQLQTVTSQTWRVNHDYIFSPSLINHVTAGVDRYVNPYTNTSVGKGWDTALGITGMPQDLGAFPQLNFSGGTASPITMGLTSNGLGAQTRYSISDSVTWTHGKHTMKFGFYHWRYDNNSRNQSNTAGSFSFSNQTTSQPDSPSLPNWGSSFASFLLGDVNSAGTTLQSTTGYRFYSYSLFAQDDWRVNSKLTLSYGLRWDVAPAPYEVNNQVSSFSPTVMNPVGIPGALVFGGTGPGRTGNQFIKTWTKGFGPRLGFAYALNPKTIIRSSGGIYYSDQAVSGGYTAGFTASPSFSGANPFTYVYNWGTAGFPQNYTRPPQLTPDFQNNQSITWLLAQGTRLPQILSWTFGIQRELANNLSLDVAYIGSHSTHLAAGSNFNYVDQKYLSLGNLLLQTAGSPGAAAANVPVPFAGFTGYSRNTVAQALMPYPQYTSVGTGAENDPVGSARFNSLQVKLTKRYSNGLTLLAFWTWMKNMSTLQSVQYTPFRPITYSGDSPPSTFVLNASYDLPFGPKKRFVNSTNPVVVAVIGGWNLAGYCRYTDGSAMSFSASNNLSTLGYGAKFANYVPGVPIFGTTDPRNFDPAVSRYFAPAGAFVTPPLYQFGNTAPTLDWVRGFTQKAESVSMGKTFPIKERLQAEFRMDVNNPFNFVRWNNPNTSFTSANYGQVTSAADGRKVQLYLTVEF